MMLKRPTRVRSTRSIKSRDARPTSRFQTSYQQIPEKHRNERNKNTSTAGRDFLDVCLEKPLAYRRVQTVHLEKFNLNTSADGTMTAGNISGADENTKIMP
jgi:hypothetical protein